MSRTKKSRKPGAGSSGTPKPKQADIVVREKRPKKHKGKVAGTRQLEATKQSKSGQNQPKQKDPRIGSKKPIVLVADSPTKSAPLKTQPKKQPPLAQVRAVENTPSLAEQLHAIEQDEKLLEILSKQENQVALTEGEVQYFNELMEQHQKISDQLDDNSEDINSEKAPTSDDDDLWDKLDNFNSKDWQD